MEVDSEGRRYNLLILTTGGTIGSASSGDGMKPVEGTNDRVVQKALRKLGVYGFSRSQLNIETMHLMNEDSTDMDSEKQKRIAQAVFSHMTGAKYDAIVVTHGTDTMAETLSRLSFMVRNPSIPVVFTGATYPIENADSDAASNLADAIAFALQVRHMDSKGGIFCVFGGRVLDGAMVSEEKFTIEINGKDREHITFIDPDGLVATVNNGRVTFEIRYTERAIGSRKETPYLDTSVDDYRIFVMRLDTSYTPEIVAGALKGAVEGGADAIVVIGYGSHGLPKHLLGVFADAHVILQEKGGAAPLILVPSSYSSKSTPGKYKVSRDAKEVGIIFASGTIPFVVANAAASLAEVRKAIANIGGAAATREEQDRIFRDAFNRNYVSVGRRRAPEYRAGGIEIPDAKSLLRGSGTGDVQTRRQGTQGNGSGKKLMRVSGS